MSFAPLLRDIVENCGGGIAVALMQSDGIPIEEVTLDSETLTDGIETAAAEFGRILDEIRKASDAIAGGPSIETVVSLARMSLVFRSVDEDTFLVLAVRPDGNLGKARYLMRKQLLALRQML
jgi:predicted regulator of Ras-like GTPase activity (Roadblock/LC7/MglB family)